MKKNNPLEPEPFIARTKEEVVALTHSQKEKAQIGETDGYHRNK